MFAHASRLLQRCGVAARNTGTTTTNINSTSTARLCLVCEAARRELSTVGMVLPPPPEQTLRRRVVVTGLGAVTPLGVGLQASWAALLEGQVGVKATTGDKFARFPSRVAARVPLPDGKGPECLVEPRDVREQGVGFIAYAMAAARAAIEDAGLQPSDMTQEQLDRTGVAVGSGIGCLEDVAATTLVLQDMERGYNKVSPFFVPRILVNMAAGHISIKHGFRGPNHTAATACATGANGIGDAFNFIKLGDADIMIAGGTESAVNEHAFAGFCRARALTTKFNDEPHRASRPFDKDRSGFVLGEGAGIMVLEEYEHAKRRGATIYAEVRGYGLSAEASHITAPVSDGNGSHRAMAAALRGSGVLPEHIDYINAHATSTPVGDPVETRGIASLLASNPGGSPQRPVTVSSTKGATGHLLGAAGAVEAIFSVLAVAQSSIPPTANLECLDPAIAELSGSVEVVGGEARSQPVRAALSNSFGFGGTNASLLFSAI